MKKWVSLIVAVFALYSIANAQLVTPGGGSGAASSIQFTNASLPVTSASAGAQCLQTNAGNTAVVLGACAGGGAYPAGSPPQIGGFSALNTSEGETVGGDATFARAGANSYTLTVTKTSGVAFTGLATAAIPLSVSNGGTGSTTLTANAPLLGNGTSALALGTRSGNTTTFGTTTGTLTSGHCVQIDASGNLIDAGAACGTGGGAPIFTHTLAAGSAATMVVNSSSTPATDINYESPTANFTATTPAAAGMADGEEILFETINAGSAWTVTFAAGAGVTLKTIVAGDANATPGAVCIPPATGNTWYRWQWDNSGARATMTLLACGPTPSAVLSVAQGGTGLNTLTSGAPLFGNGTGAITNGTKSGNTTEVMSATGSFTSGDILKADANGNAVDAGAMALGFDFIGTPTASMVEAYTCAYTLNFPTNFASPTSQASCNSNPAETDAYTVAVNGVSKGTVSLSTSCVATLTAASPFTCTAGQRLTLTAPATVSGTDIAITLAYTR